MSTAVQPAATASGSVTMHECQSCHRQRPRTAVEPLTLDLGARRGTFDTTMVYRCTDPVGCLAHARRFSVGAFRPVAA